MPKKKIEKIEEEVLLEDDELDSEEELFEEEDDDDFEEEYEDDDELEEESLEEETEAAATLRPGSKPAGSKAEMMSTLMNAMSGMSNGDMIKFFELVMAQAQQSNATIPGNASAQNQASVQMKGSPVKEDLEAIFGDSEELSEEFKEKIETLFEAAVNTKIQVEIARLEEEYEEKMKEEVESIASELQENVDRYLQYAATEWLEENKVAVDSYIRTELTESFINDLAGLCRSYNIDLPENEDDVLEKLATRVGELEEQLNESEAEKIELRETIESINKELIIEQIADELPATAYEKFKSLAENIEYEDDESFVRKLGHIKEGFFQNRSVKEKSTQLISEEIAEDAEDEGKVIFEDPAVKLIHETISRTVKR